ARRARAAARHRVAPPRLRRGRGARRARAPAARDRRAGEERLTMDDLIRFERVERSFDGKPGLRGLDLSARPGEIFALLGRNGAGKAAGVWILVGELGPMRGRSTLLGEDSTALSPATRLAVGVVHEGAPMYRWMTVQDAVAFEAGTRPNFGVDYAHAALARL